MYTLSCGVHCLYIHKHMYLWSHFHVYTETTLLKYGVNIDLLHHKIIRVMVCILTHILIKCTISVALIIKCTLFCAPSVQVWMKWTLNLHLYTSVQPGWLSLSYGDADYPFMKMASTPNFKKVWDYWLFPISIWNILCKNMSKKIAI